MEINVNIKCPDLPIAAAALAKALSAIGSSSSATESLGGRAEEPNPATASAPTSTGVSVTPQAPAAAPMQAPVAANPIPPYAPSMGTPGAVPIAPTPAAVPTSPAPQITGDMVAKAGADLIAANPAAMAQLNALLQKYGVSCAQELRPDQIGPFATEMRALGAKV